ncbi:hypothetical protein [Vannielia sp.]|uniref:hypothetical protein n=1 Tax=Vannielia sp. TaxID=2813045 RepID=UPI002603AF00|nr:hypothetical protein [Vannielia sp.]MDF1873385.1 hypothetical protein [Vannielia sp.]
MGQADNTAQFDPKGLMRDVFRMEGSGLEETRSIFVDWALSLPEGAEQTMALKALFEQYGRHAPDHPMTAVLKAGMEDAGRPRRRGGRLGRRN